MFPRIVGVLVLILVLSPASAFAQAVPKTAPTTTIDVRQLPAMETPAPFSPERATHAYLSRIHGDGRQRSDAYFEGRYALLFLDALYAIAVSALLLFTRISV